MEATAEKNTVYFATGNKHKFLEAKEILSPAMDILHFDFKHAEIRSDSLEEIATDSVKHAFEKLQKPVFVEDSGLFIDALNGFPGTFSAWAYNKIGIGGILKLLGKEKNRSAEFRACIAFSDGKTLETFAGVCKGTIPLHMQGKTGFGYDPVFIPASYNESFAQSIELKNKLSHRYKALQKFANYFTLNRR